MLSVRHIAPLCETNSLCLGLSEPKVDVRYYLCIMFFVVVLVPSVSFSQFNLFLTIHWTN
jgi:hypothetical protein